MASSPFLWEVNREVNFRRFAGDPRWASSCVPSVGCSARWWSRFGGAEAPGFPECLSRDGRPSSWPRGAAGRVRLITDGITLTLCYEITWSVGMWDLYGVCVGSGENGKASHHIWGHIRHIKIHR